MTVELVESGYKDGWKLAQKHHQEQMAADWLWTLWRPMVIGLTYYVILTYLAVPQFKAIVVTLVLMIYYATYFGRRTIERVGVVLGIYFLLLWIGFVPSPEEIKRGLIDGWAQVITLLHGRGA